MNDKAKKSALSGGFFCALQWKVVWRGTIASTRFGAASLAGARSPGEKLAGN
jgi:hypothetical protein